MKFSGITRWLVAGAITLALSTAVWADATGKWTFTTRRGNSGNEIQQTLELKQEGEKLTGALIGGRNNQRIEIKEGTAKGNEIAFKVVRQFNNREITTSYKGKVDGNTIKGTITSVIQGQERSREWTANRAN